MHCTVDVTVPFLVKERKFSENKKIRTYTFPL
jgi:hypothetical protein